MPTFWLRRPTPTQCTRGSSISGERGQREGAVGEDVDLRPRIGADQRPRGAHRLDETGGQVVRPRGSDGRHRAVAVARTSRR